MEYTSAAESAATFYILIILKVITEVMTQFYQNTRKALEIQYRHKCPVS
jgi:hypothetical protein